VGVIFTLHSPNSTGVQNLANREVVITGASAGIGAETAQMMAAAGANVTIGARRKDRLENLASSLREQFDVIIRPVETDVTDPNSVSELFDSTDGEAVDVVVSNAGMAHPGDVEMMSDDEYRDMIAVNIDGMFFTAREAIPRLRETCGMLIFVGSFAGIYPRSGNPVYAGTKWWTRGFAHSLMAQIGDDDIGVGVVNPSEVRTEFGHQRDASAAERFAPGEVTEPETVAQAIAFMAQHSSGQVVAELDLFRRDKLSML
jgi:Short-chain alcohol dehydrogenase of unknown specificity